MNNYIVETNQLSKDFSGEVAVNQLSIHIRKNEILDVEKIKNEINAGKVAFGFTPQSAEQIIKIVAKYIK